MSTTSKAENTTIINNSEKRRGEGGQLASMVYVAFRVLCTNLVSYFGSRSPTSLNFSTNCIGIIDFVFERRVQSKLYSRPICLSFLWVHYTTGDSSSTIG
jgi:hypothetical protein